MLDGRSLGKPANYALVRIKPPKATGDRRGKAAICGDRPARRARSRESAASRWTASSASRSSSVIPATSSCSSPAAAGTDDRVGLLGRDPVHAQDPRAASRPGQQTLRDRQLPGRLGAVMLAALAPDLLGPILLAGSPISYWAGVGGINPMRYSGACSAEPGSLRLSATSARASSTAPISSTTSRT